MWIHNIKLYIEGSLTTLSAAEVKTTALITPDYEVDQDGLLFFGPRSTPADVRNGVMRLVIQELLQRYFFALYPHQCGR